MELEKSILNEVGKSQKDTRTPHVLSLMWILASTLYFCLFNIKHLYKPENYELEIP